MAMQCEQARNLMQLTSAVSTITTILTPRPGVYASETNPFATTSPSLGRDRSPKLLGYVLTLTLSAAGYSLSGNAASDADSVNRVPGLGGTS